MKTFPKKIIISILIFVAAILLIWIGSAAYSSWQGYQWQKETDAFQESLRKPYKEDAYGGKTPEETWTMFLDALKKGDVELASKYFVVEKQAQEKQDLQKAKDEGRLEQVIKGFSKPLEKQGGDPSEKARYIIPFVNKSGQVEAYPVIFSLNPYTDIWKLFLLPL